MFVSAPVAAVTPLEDDVNYWSFCSDYTDLDAAGFAEVVYPLSPEAISPGPTYEHCERESYYLDVGLGDMGFSAAAAAVACNGRTPLAHPLAHFPSPGNESVVSAQSQAQVHSQVHEGHSEGHNQGAYPLAHSMAATPPHGHSPQQWCDNYFIKEESPEYDFSSDLPGDLGLAAAMTPTRQSMPLTPITPIHLSNTSSSKVQLTPQMLRDKIQALVLDPHNPRVALCTDKLLRLWIPLRPMDQERCKIILERAATKGLDPTTVFQHLEMFPDNDWNKDCPPELCHFPVISISVGGTAPDHKSKHVKRPLNSFMIYRKAQTQRARLNASVMGAQINHQIISSIIGLLWQTEGGRVHEVFSDAAGVEKYLHGEQHPNYKFKPRKKRVGRRASEGGA